MAGTAFKGLTQKGWSQRETGLAQTGGPPAEPACRPAGRRTSALKERPAGHFFHPGLACRWLMGNCLGRLGDALRVCLRLVCPSQACLGALLTESMALCLRKMGGTERRARRPPIRSKRLMRLGE